MRPGGLCDGDRAAGVGRGAKRAMDLTWDLEELDGLTGRRANRSARRRRLPDASGDWFGCQLARANRALDPLSQISLVLLACWAVRGAAFEAGPTLATGRSGASCGED